MRPWLACMARPAPLACPVELGGAGRSRPELARHAYLLLFTIGVTADRGALATEALAAYHAMLRASGWLRGGAGRNRGAGAASGGRGSRRGRGSV